VGSFLLVLGVLTVLAVSFASGVVAGRHWPRLLPSLGGGVLARAEREEASRGRGRTPSGRGGLTPAPAERPAPVLTFYHELTAPLAAPPPPAKPRPDGTERPAKAETEAAKAETEAPKPELPGTEPSAERRFTVQVGAFKTREQAEAVRARLAGDGHDDAYVADLEGPPGARFRVRVGTFVTREEARQAAERLAVERQVAAYVTTR
jgi:cell division protein FtsN